jgi:hypothetical protein
VKRPKPPVLTSPWKIGFFVSLMLVVVSSAVAYFFLRKTGISWVAPVWTDWHSILDSVTQGEGAVFELWPLLAIVSVTSLLSYVVITQAVRKYKRYLDSGLDYKNLLATLREIRDLEDTSRIAKLQNHPELRDFLLKTRDTLAERSELLNEREMSLEKRTLDTAQQLEEQLCQQLGGECDTLVGAIETAMKATFPEQIELERPELKRVAQALQVAFADRIGRGEHEHLEQKLADISRRLDEGIDAGREVEKNLTELATSAGTAQATGTENIQKDAQGLLSSLDETRQLSASLGAIGEEAKGVAINTALKAGSGKGTQADLIQLADDVKEIAAHFGELSKSYLTLTDGMTGSVNAIQADLNRYLDSMNASPRSTEAVGVAAGKISRCLEHLVVLSEKIKGGVEATAPAPPQEATPEPDGEKKTAYEANDYGFETLDRSRPIFSEEKDDVSTIPGLRKDHDEVIGGVTSESDMFAELSDGQQAAPSPPEDHDEFRQDHVDSTRSPKPDSKMTPADELEVESDLVDLPPGVQHSDIPAVQANVEEHDVIDLYALGAVDYDPALHN